MTAIPLASGFALAACSSSPGSSGSTTTSSGGSTAAASAPCVPNVAKVIARKPTAASTTATLPAALVAKLDAAGTSSFAQTSAPGAVVGIRTPEGTWVKAYGVTDPSTKAPMTTDMHLRIGSVTKTFTGTLVLQLAQEGKLSLDDPISKYVPGIPNGNKITLAMLADMTSGVASYTLSKPFTDKYFTHPETVYTPDQLIAAGVADSPKFAPGARYDYSNTNTVLLGKVIEKVTGQPVTEVMQQRIFDPLGLTGTSFPTTSPTIPAPHPQGYTLQGVTTPPHPVNATDWSPSFFWTSGALISNVSDLLTYARALGTGQGLLSAKTQTERLDSFPRPAGYGLGLACRGGWVGHTGELPGFNSTLFYDTTSDTSAVVIANSDIASGKCPESPTLNGGETEIPCMSPAMRIFVALSKALGHQFEPNPAR